MKFDYFRLKPVIIHEFLHVKINKYIQTGKNLK